jgi:hypothetical protein
MVWSLGEKAQDSDCFVEVPIQILLNVSPLATFVNLPVFQLPDFIMEIVAVQLFKV